MDKVYCVFETYGVDDSPRFDLVGIFKEPIEAERYCITRFEEKMGHFDPAHKKITKEKPWGHIRRDQCGAIDHGAFGGLLIEEIGVV